MREPDPRLTDEATGLPPLQELGNDNAMFVLAWATGSGVVANDFTHSDEPVRFLHLRGLIPARPESGFTAEWAQVHIAIPASALMDLVTDLAKGWDD